MWVDRYKTSLGTNVVYPLMTIGSTDMGIPVTMVFTGKYDGPESVSVPKGNFNPAYHFELIGDLQIAGGSLGSLTVTESDWLVPNVGVVKTNQPMDSTKVLTQTVSAGGREQEMTANGVLPASVAPGNSISAPAIRFNPNPASDNLTLSLTREANRVFLYDATGRMVRSFDLATRTGDALLWVKDIPNGMYLARVQYANGTSGSQKILIQH